MAAGNKKGGENKMEVLYENEYIQIRLNIPHNCIEYQWKKHASNEELKNLMGKVYRYVSVHGCTKLLPDLRNLKKLPDEILLWTESEWLPLLVKQGVRIYAVVSANSSLSRDTTIKTSKNEFVITTRYFEDVLKARSWLSRL